MATYHGITRATCLACEYTTTDTTTLEMWNDYGGHCPQCGAQRTEWQANGRTTITIVDDSGEPRFFESGGHVRDLTADECESLGLDPTGRQGIYALILDDARPGEQ